MSNLDQRSNQTLGDTVSRISRKRFNAFEPNGGERTFSILPERCHDKTVPFTSDDETMIRITHPNHDVHQLQDTFIYFEFRVLGSLTPNVRLPALFLGWRDANQILKNLRVYSNNVQTDYIQRDCAKEGFHKASKMSDEERHCQLFAHTREVDAINYQSSICGTYIDFATDTNSTYFTSEFAVVLPITDIPAFENFKDVSAPGLDITLKFSINAESLMCCQVDVGKYNQYEDLYYYKEVPIDVKYQLHSLTNVTLYDEYYLQSQNVNISITSLTCTKCQCECYGYNVRPDVRLALAEQALKPLLIPCTKLEIYKMPDTLTTGSTSYASITHANLEDVKEIAVMIPFDDHPTYYPIVRYSSIQLYVDGKPYPIDPESMTLYNPRLISHLVRSRKNKGMINESTLASMIPDNDIDPSSCEYGIVFQTKRNRDGMFVWDGLDSDGKRVSLDLRFALSTALTQTVRPEIWVIRDTSWLLDINGLKYINYQNHLKTHKELGWLTQSQ